MRSLGDSCETCVFSSASRSGCISGRHAGEAQLSSEPTKDVKLRCLNLSARLLRSLDGLCIGSDPLYAARDLAVPFEREDVRRLCRPDGRTKVESEASEDFFERLRNRRGLDELAEVTVVASVLDADAADSDERYCCTVEVRRASVRPSIDGFSVCKARLLPFLEELGSVIDEDELASRDSDDEAVRGVPDGLPSSVTLPLRRPRSSRELVCPILLAVHRSRLPAEWIPPNSYG